MIWIQIYIFRREMEIIFRCEKINYMYNFEELLRENYI